ncbi:MAG: ECF transporter S component, partial [Clostridiales bacterium]|nr:ECF transporter S component [Clostridiales bacterium]
MENQKIKKLTLGGALSALVLLFTYIFKIPVPATGGYVHLGDGIIFLAAALLGPYAAFIGGIGSALADLMGG